MCSSFSFWSVVLWPRRIGLSHVRSCTKRLWNFMTNPGNCEKKILFPDRAFSNKYWWNCNKDSCEFYHRIIFYSCHRNWKIVQRAIAFWQNLVARRNKVSWSGFSLCFWILLLLAKLLQRNTEDASVVIKCWKSNNWGIKRETDDSTVRRINHNNLLMIKDNWRPSDKQQSNYSLEKVVAFLIFANFQYNTLKS